jgi:hypothetical protein
MSRIIKKKYRDMNYELIQVIDFKTKIQTAIYAAFNDGDVRITSPNFDTQTDAMKWLKSMIDENLMNQ